MSEAALVLAIVAAAVTAVSLYFAKRAAEAANTATRIELQRRHAELRPHFKVTCQRLNAGSEQLRLVIELAGPPDLERLEEITVTIRDDNYFRLKPVPVQGTPDRVPDQVWGPVRFVPGTGPGVTTRPDATGADPAGRETRSIGMPVGESHVYALQPTPPPAGSTWTPEMWKQQVGTMLRLRIEGRRDGWEPWTVVGEIDAEGEVAVVNIP